MIWKFLIFQASWKFRVFEEFQFVKILVTKNLKFLKSENFEFVIYLKGSSWNFKNFEILETYQMEIFNI
jgi:hypothetical protein